MADKITENTLIFDAIQINPDAGNILMKYGMHCLGCPGARSETIEQACMVHGADCDALIDEINALIGE